MKKRIIIRPLEKIDTKALLEFANTLIAEDTFLMLSGKKMTYKEEDKYVRDSLAGMKKHEKIRLVATDGDLIVGSAEIRRGDRRKRHVGELGISILKPYRGQGLGNRLMETLIAESNRLGLRMIILHCFETNSAAIAMYKKFGFTQSGTIPGAYLYKGDYVGEVTLYKNL